MVTYISPFRKCPRRPADVASPCAEGPRRTDSQRRCGPRRHPRNPQPLRPAGRPGPRGGPPCRVRAGRRCRGRPAPARPGIGGTGDATGDGTSAASVCSGCPGAGGGRTRSGRAAPGWHPDSGRRRTGPGRGGEMAAMAAEQVRRQARTPEQRLAGRLAAQQPRRPGTARTKAVTALTELGQLDQSVYLAVAGTPTPVLDPLLRRLSRLADRSRLWVGIAAAMAAVGRPPGPARRRRWAGRAGCRLHRGQRGLQARRAAPAAGPRLGARAGPPPGADAELGVVLSGHAAAGFAFATAVGQTRPGSGSR